MNMHEIYKKVCSGNPFFETNEEQFEEFVSRSMLPYEYSLELQRGGELSPSTLSEIDAVISYFTKVDAIESVQLLADHTFPNITKKVAAAKRKTDISQSYESLLKARNASGLLYTPTRMLVLGDSDEHEEDAEVADHAYSALKNSEKWHFAIKPVFKVERDKDGVNQSIKIVYPASNKLPPEILATIKAESQFAASSISDISIKLGVSCSVSLALLSDPMIDEYIHVAALSPRKARFLEVLSQSRAISEHFRPTMALTEVTPLSSGQLDLLLITNRQPDSNNASNLNNQRLSNILGSVSEDYNCAVETYREAVAPLVDTLKRSFSAPTGYSEIKFMSDRVSDSLLEEVFDRYLILGDLVNRFEQSADQVAYLPMSKLLLLLYSGSLEFDYPLSFPIYIKSSEAFEISTPA